MSTTVDREVWIKRTEAARRLGIGVKALKRMVAAGHLTVRELPGTHPRVLLADVERVASTSIRPADAGRP